MVLHYTEESILTLFSSEKFKNSIALKRSTNQDTLSDILDNIDINKQYFRMGITKKKKKPHGIVCDDTQVIKYINQSFNKLTDVNIQEIYTIIKDNILLKKYLIPLIIENIFIKCISQSRYIHLYVQIIELLVKDKIIQSKVLLVNLNKCEKFIHSQDTDTSSEYSQLCNRNKKIDNLVGYSKLISILEKHKLIHNKIQGTISSLLESIELSTLSDERYQYIQCLLTIIESNNDLYPSIQGNIGKLISKETSMKNKFKLLDIQDLNDLNNK
jgi:hypothetical protein